MKMRNFETPIVIIAAVSAAVFSVYSQTDWLSENGPTIARERCYGIVKAGKNDCANTKHSCATQATVASDPDEWLMLPKGLCERIFGGKNE